MVVPLSLNPNQASILKVIPISGEERQQLDTLSQRDSVYEVIGRSTCQDMEEEMNDLKTTEL